MQLVYIHGANATPSSFNYIRTHLGDGIALSYDSHMGFKNNLNRMKEELLGYSDIVFIAHSLGGVYSLHLADHMPDRVMRAVTMSTPYGGHHAADYARLFMPFDPLLNDIGTRSWPIVAAMDIKIRWPWCNIVTTKGHVPWIFDQNDGVVTIDSQKVRTDMELAELDLNHYEVVLSPMTLAIITDRISQPK